MNVTTPLVEDDDELDEYEYLYGYRLIKAHKKFNMH